MIRHARGWRSRSPPLPISPLPVAVIETAFRTLLQTSIGATLLLGAGLSPAFMAAIAMATVAARTDLEHRAAPLPATRALTQNQPVTHRRVHPSADGLDNGSRFMSG